MSDEFRLYMEHYRLHRATIEQRLQEFRAVPVEEYLWELIYCLLTPGSRARHAEAVVSELRRDGFLERRFDPTPYLRDPAHYIRFHNRKGSRLLDVAERGAEIAEILVDSRIDSRSKRERLVAAVPGLGWKEGSHLLRNIGHLDLAIIDRHILKHMLRTGAISAIPESIGGRRVYLELEERFIELAERIGLAPQELDLLFWSFEEGSVRK
jgi:N-glycosylase/DNA lyase